MTVDPRLRLTPGEYLIHPDGSASKVVDKRNMTVDEILATGWYTDRQGREWHLCRHGGFVCMRWHNGHPSRGLEPGEMYLRIERDRHRAECPGLIDCTNHPVPSVTITGPYGCFHVNPADTSDETYVAHECSHEGAMDAARALAVGE